MKDTGGLLGKSRRVSKSEAMTTRRFWKILWARNRPWTKWTSFFVQVDHAVCSSTARNQSLASFRRASCMSQATWHHWKMSIWTRYNIIATPLLLPSIPFPAVFAFMRDFYFYTPTVPSTVHVLLHCRSELFEGGRGGGIIDIPVFPYRSHTHFCKLAYGTSSSVNDDWQAFDHYCHVSSACWVFSSFWNPPNSDMHYTIFKVRMWSYIYNICVRIHTGVGHMNSESEQHFGFRKTH